MFQVFHFETCPEIQLIITDFLEHAPSFVLSCPVRCRARPNEQTKNDGDVAPVGFCRRGSEKTAMPTLNPILNNPYAPPGRHYHTAADGSLDYGRILDGRRLYRPDQSMLPVGTGPQGDFGEWLTDEACQHHPINLLRREVGAWRQSGYRTPATPTRVTLELLAFWFDPHRPPQRRLFFAQREAVETAIYLNEIAPQSNAGTHLLSLLREAQGGVSENADQQLPRIAFKMATGTGKTVVMAALLLYHYGNRQEYRQDPRFADYFLIVAPGVTIKERLGVLYADTEAAAAHLARDYYRQRDLLPRDWQNRLEGLNARLKIVNYHAFEPRTLQGNQRSPFDGKRGPDGKKVEAKESPGQMLRRVLGSGFKPDSRLLVINDEAHHCYLPKAGNGKGRGGNDDGQDNERAARWVTGLVELGRRFKLTAVYDLSATPYYLSGSGYRAYELFPWVVSDFGLVEAMESGLVKIPFLPERDNTQQLDMPVLRNLYEHVKAGLPGGSRRGQKEAATADSDGPGEAQPNLPGMLVAALDQFHGHYQRLYQRRRGLFETPPVFIVVCANTVISKEVYKHIAGYERTLADRSTVNVPGCYAEFSNFDPATLLPRPRPPTLLIDSVALEEAELIDASFKKLFAPEIAEFKRAYRLTHPHQSVEQIDDQDLLREVLNTVGKTGTLGAQVRCVVSVAMLTEGWDCLDSATEILTPNGWVGIGQIDEGNLIYALNRESGKLETVPVLEYGERSVRLGEKMIRIKSQHSDIRTTEGHQFHIKYRNPRQGGSLSQNFLTFNGRELSERQSAYALPLAAESDEDFAGVPLSDDELRLVAWFMTDGGFSGYQLLIHQAKAYHHEIRELLNRLHLDYVEKLLESRAGRFANAQPLYRFSIPKGTRTDALKRNGWFPYADYLHKSVAPALHAMTKRQFLLFWQELLKGDGQKTGNKTGWLWCCEKAQVDAYTQMAAVRGLSASYREVTTRKGKKVYRVSIRERQWLTSDPQDRRAAKIILEDPVTDEKVWCVRNRNATVVTRRNGKIVILGNCSTVSHIVGVRAFLSQLLCEQVAGRALRREHYDVRPYTLTGEAIADTEVHRYKPENVVWKFPPEFAYLIGVPFRIFPGNDATPAVNVNPPDWKEVVALPDRAAAHEITFPNVTAYRVVLREAPLTADFSGLPPFVVDGTRWPLVTIMEAFGQKEALSVREALSALREQTVVYRVTRAVVRAYFCDADGNPDVGRFPALRAIVERWYREQVQVIGVTDAALFKKALFYLVQGQEAARVCQAVYQGLIRHARQARSGEVEKECMDMRKRIMRMEDREARGIQTWSKHGYEESEYLKKEYEQLCGSW
jgi:hypothetical protein